ncbi:MAG: inositol-3-phosphate synthase [Thermodesulfobacteriota bacterium]|nr:inositol-3-phosphate synthase [Thermodesulfobacteriota bacterium]
MKKNSIRIAIVGVGNCASALVQGIEFYRDLSRKNPRFEPLGLMHMDLGGYKPWDIEVGAAFDIDRRKVGKPLREAIFAKPNCTKTIYSHFNDSGVIISMGEVMDGVSEHMRDYPEDRTFVVASEKPCNVEKTLKESGVEIVLNYLPVGSDLATQFYAEVCLNAGVSFINCMPSFIVSDSEWAKRFEEKGIPVVGDDVKSQMGATIIHRALVKLFEDRGVKLDRTYQINTGGNTDFLNMLNRNRLQNKRISKTEAIQSQLGVPLESENIHIGPSDYVPWQNDNKVCFLRMEGRGFGEVPLNLELRLSVEDSPNSGGITIDTIRCCKIARNRGIGGPLISISAYAMKHPLIQFPDSEAKVMVEEFIEGKRER